MRVASIDIGTNTALLLIAETSKTAGGELSPFLERATITRLGQGVDKTRTLAPEAVERTLQCLRGYAHDIRESGAERVAVVGTSAMRDAQGGESLRAAIEEILGVAPQVISGEREAALTFRGALAGLQVRPGERTVVFDIGGGSTEVVVGGAGQTAATEFAFATSIDVGSVRLTERFLRTDPPVPEELAMLDAAVAKAIEVIPAGLHADVPVGIAGTMTTLAAVSLGLVEYDADRVHGLTLPLRELRRVSDVLASIPLAKRQTIPGMEPKRADVIVAGAHIALGVLSRLGATSVRISDRGVRWGLAIELAGQA